MQAGNRAHGRYRGRKSPLGFIIAGCFRFILALSSLGAARADEVSREAPAIYGEKLAALLTPTPKVLKAADGMDCTGSSGLVLANEWIHYVSSDGRRMLVHQVAYKTLTDAGVAPNSDYVFTFRKKEQKFYLVVAESIQPNGTVLPVKPNAILLQTPQRQADYSLYDDQAEVRVIFPDVKPGTVTHAIVVIEDLATRMPGEFSLITTWDAGWPIARQSEIVDLPAEMAHRLQIFKIGADAPEPRRVKLTGDRVRLTWERIHIPTPRDEIAPAPASQEGPVVHLSTIASWDTVGLWYSGLLKGTDRLSPALASKVDEWTNKAHSPEEITRILLSKAADEVRYVGLEFGQADYQPHSCNEVWENQYGDCKDKANLLVAMLKHKKISAWLTLANTNHLGLVDKRVPDFRVFNHAIVAIGGIKPGYVFCDPTITYARPGMIGPGDADRDVLLIKDGAAEWSHTPPERAGTVRYEFDLKLSATGELSGWLTQRADGYYGVSQRSHFGRLDQDEMRNEMSRVVRGFYQGASVIDVAKIAGDPLSDVDSVKAYFTVPGQSESQASKQTLTFPQSSALYFDLGNSAERSSTFFLYQDRTQVACTVALPPTLALGTCPEGLDIHTPIWANRAKWQFDKGTCRMELEMSTFQSAFSPKEFAQYYNAMQTVRAWLAKPVVLSADQAAGPAAVESAELDLPLMPTADGQLDLIDNRYPENGNRDLRRAALLKAVQFFPTDRALAYRVGVQIATIDWNEDKNQQAFDRIQILLTDYKSDVTPDTFAWGEIMQGLFLRDLKRESEALAIFTRIARDTTLPNERRAAAAYDAATITGANSSPEVLSLLRQVAPLQSSLRAGIYARMAYLVLKQGKASDLRECLEGLDTSKSDDREEILIRLVQDAKKWTNPGDDENQRLVLSLVRELAPSPTAELKAAVAAGQLHVSCVQIQTQIRELLATKPFSEWYKPSADEALKSFDDFDRAIAKANANSSAESCLQLNLQLLLKLPVGDDFPERLWKAASFADWMERQKNKAGGELIFTSLLDLCDRLPNDQGYYFEGRILRAKRLSRNGDPHGEQAVYEDLLKSPDLGNSLLVAVSKLLGASQEITGDYASALQTYRQLEPFVADRPAAVGGLLRAVFINLHQGRNDEALRLIQLLEKCSDNVVKEAPGAPQIREFVQLRKSGQAAAFWAAKEQWWPGWQNLADSLGVPALGKDVVVPVIPDLVELGKEMGQFRRDTDRQQYLGDYNKLASAARWLPSLAAEVASLAVINSQIFPAKTTEFRRVFISLLAAPHPAEVPGLRSRQLYLAANYVDNQQPRDALRVVAEFNAVSQPNDVTSQGVRRVWALAALATKTEISASAAALESDLKSPELTTNRANTVYILADLYRAQRRSDDQEALLKRELDNPAVVSDSAAHSVLSNRYNQLIGSRQLATKVSAWIRDFPLEWYEFVEPSNLDDPRLRNLDEVLKDPRSQFSAAEAIKLQLLVAQDTGESLDVQRHAWKEALRNLYYQAPNQDRINRLAETVIGDEAFEEDVRTTLLWYIMVGAAEEGRKEEFARWQKHPLFAKMDPLSADQLASAALLVASDQTSSTSIKAMITALAAKPIGSLEVMIVREALDNLLRSGDFTGARAVLDQIASWHLDSGLAKTPEALQFDFSKQVRNAEESYSLQESLVQIILKAVPNIPDQMPVPYKDLRLLSVPQSLTPELTFQACLNRIKTRYFDHDGFRFWTKFVRSFPPRPENESLMLELFRAALAEAKTDDLRADAVQFILSSADLDNTALRTQIAALLASYREVPDAPLTTAQMRIFDIRVALRTGRAIDLSTAFDGLRAPWLNRVRPALSLRYYLQTGDKSALKQLVDELDSSQLLNPYQLDVTVPSFDLLGMKSEAELARKTARRECRLAVETSWVSLDETEARFALELAEILDSPEVLPPAWVKAISTGTGDPWLRQYVLLVDAWLRRNWEEANRQAAQLIEFSPTYYHLYWYRGMALHNLGRDKEAVAPLTVYTRYSKDELEYPKALALLQKLASTKP